MTVLDAQRGGHEALLVPKVEGGFDILVDPRPRHGRAVHDEVAHQRLSRRRVRFRIAHEIGHSFFYDRRCRPARRLLNHSDAEERFCDAFASALLVPPTTVTRRAATPKTVSYLSSKLDVSVELAGRAVAKSNPGIAVLGLRPVSDATGTAFGVLWSTTTPGFPPDAELTGHWVDVATREGGADRILDLGRKRGVFRLKIERVSRTYWVASIVRHAAKRETVDPLLVTD